MTYLYPERASSEFRGVHKILQYDGIRAKVKLRIVHLIKIQLSIFQNINTGPSIK